MRVVHSLKVRGFWLWLRHRCHSCELGCFYCASALPSASDRYTRDTGPYLIPEIIDILDEPPH